MKKFLATALSCAMLMSMGTVGFSAAVNKSEVTQSGGAGESRVTVDIASAKFKATVPTVLPIYVDSENVVSVANNARIANASSGPVEVKNARVENVNSWSIVPFNTDFKKVPVNLKQYGMIINNSEVATTGSFSIAGFDVIPGDETIPVTYDANVAIQSDPLKDYNIGKVVFTVGWATPMKYYSDLSTFAADIANGTTANGSVAQANDSAIGMSAGDGIIRVKLVKDVNNAPAINLENSSAALDLDLNGYTLNLNDKSWIVPSNTQIYNGTLQSEAAVNNGFAIRAGTSSALADNFEIEDLHVITHYNGTATDTKRTINVRAKKATITDVTVDYNFDANANAAIGWNTPFMIGGGNVDMRNITVNTNGGTIHEANGTSAFSGVVALKGVINVTNYTCKTNNVAGDWIYGFYTNDTGTVNIDECDIDISESPKEGAGIGVGNGATVNITDKTGPVSIKHDKIGIRCLDQWGDGGALNFTSTNAQRATVSGKSWGVTTENGIVAALNNINISSDGCGISSTDTSTLTLTNCDVSAGTLGVNPHGNANATINGGSITATGKNGLYVQNSAKATVTNCDITAPNFGAAAFDDTRMDITGGTITANGAITDDLSIRAVNYAGNATGTVKNATLVSNRYGAFATDNANATFENCTINAVTAGTATTGSATMNVVNSTVVGVDAGHFAASNGNLVATNSDFTGRNAVSLFANSTATINGGVFTGDALGVYSKETAHFDITGANINANGAAVWAEGHSTGSIRNSTATSLNSSGLGLGDRDTNGAPSCTVESTTLKGTVAFNITDNGTLTLNPGTILQYTGNRESDVAPGGTVIDNR